MALGNAWHFPGNPEPFGNAGARLLTVTGPLRQTQAGCRLEVRLVDLPGGLHD